MNVPRKRRAVAGLGLAWLAACGIVEVPDERYYRLAYPRPAAGALQRGGALRVGRLALAAHLTGDRLLVAEGPVQLRPWRFHRWAGSLEALVGDTLVTGLVRSLAFRRVLTSADSGSADVELSGRVLEFQQEVDGDGAWFGRVVLDLQLVESSTGAVLLREEFGSRVPIATRDPAGVVGALSEGIAEVVDQLLVRGAEVGAIGGGVEAGPGR
ncbi:MAG: ABC-type transport auxiliary lipoprotein family protein [Planctomycetota bacterium]